MVSATTNGRSMTLAIAIESKGPTTLFEFMSGKNSLWRDWACFGNPEHRTKHLEEIAQRFAGQHSAWSSGKVLQQLAGALAQYEKDGKQANLPSITPARLFIEQHPNMRPVVIDGVARVGETINVISSSKIGKSWLLYSLLMSIASGREWLNTFACVQGRVLLIDNELHPETLSRRLDAVACALNLPESEWRDSLDLVCLRGRGVDLNALEATIQTIEPNAYVLVAADAWYRFLPPKTDENSNADVMQLYNKIDEYAGHLGAAWVNIHHSSKGDQSAKAVTDVGSGAGSQSRAADSHLVLRPHEQDGVIVLEAAVRSFAPVDPVALRWGYPLWTRADDADPTKLKRRTTAAEEKQAALDAEGIAKIIATLAVHQSGTTRQLQGWTGMGWDRVNKLVAKLRTEGRIVSSEITSRGNSCDEHRLAPPESGDVSRDF